MRKIAVLPSLVTIGNLTCGITAIGLLVDPERNLAFFGSGPRAAAWLLILGMVFDLLDGKLARMARATSDFGAQLDSLCDAITFGVAPAMIVVSVSEINKEITWIFASLFAICTVLRLARFNVEHSGDGHKDDYFRGLPSPAGAGLIIALVLFDRFSGPNRFWTPGTLRTEVILPFAGLAAALLMVSRVRYPHLLKWLFSGKGHFRELVIVVGICCFVAYWPQMALAVLFSAYALSGILVTAKMLLVPRAFKKQESGDLKEDHSIN